MKWVIRAVRRACDMPGDHRHDLGYRRSWREDLEVRLDRKMFEIGLHNSVVSWRGPDSDAPSHSEEDPWPIGWLLFQVRFTEWHWPNEEHIYYDGCHCSWRIGPFQVHRSTGHWCRKCAGER